LKFRDRTSRATKNFKKYRPPKMAITYAFLGS
jgi:hypothetical protein